MYLCKTLQDIHFPENLSIEKKEDLLYFFFNINRYGFIRFQHKESLFAETFPIIYKDFKTWIFPNDWSFSQRMYHYLHNDINFNIGKCKNCGKQLKWVSFTKGYIHTFCSVKCSMNSVDTHNKIKNTWNNKSKEELDEINKSKQNTIIQTYGSLQTFYKNRTNKTIDTCLNKYGVENVFQTDWCKEKSKETCQEKYHVDCYNQTNKFKERCREINENRTDEEWDKIRTKIEQTCLKRYGVKNYTQTDECKEKMQNTCLERYGVKSYAQTNECKERFKEINENRTDEEWDKIIDKREQTCLEKYGVSNYNLTQECKDKIKTTNLEKYGQEYCTQTNEIKEKISQSQIKRWETMTSDDIQRRKEKSENTCLERYGVKSYTQTKEFLKKQYITKKNNNSFNTSKIEIEIQQYFEMNNINYIYQYISINYPFHCDFYLPDYDLYIEVQAHWSHGNFPYNKNSMECNNILKKMIEKSKYSPSYSDAIDTWTRRDVIKRKTAKDNNLNYLEIFSNDINTAINLINNKIKVLK